MTSDPDDGSIERIESPSNRADHANSHRPEPLAELLRAAASPVLSDRALAGEDAAIAAFREARINQRHSPAPRRHVVTLYATFAASLVALMATVLILAATRTSTPAREPSPRPSSDSRSSTESSTHSVSATAAQRGSDSSPH